MPNMCHFDQHLRVRILCPLFSVAGQLLRVDRCAPFTYLPRLSNCCAVLCMLEVCSGGGRALEAHFFSSGLQDSMPADCIQAVLPTVLFRAVLLALN